MTLVIHFTYINVNYLIIQVVIHTHNLTTMLQFHMIDVAYHLSRAYELWWGIENEWALTAAEK